MTDTRRLLWAAIWLALVLAGIKALFLDWPSGRAALAAWSFFRSLTAVSYADAAFAAIVWALARSVLRIVRRPRIVLLMVVAAALACSYQYASIQLFGTFGGFMTYPLLRLAGDVPMMHDAVAARLPPLTIAATIAAAVCYVALVVVTRRILRPRVDVRLERYVAGAALVVWLALGHSVYTATWATRQEHRVAENPHWVLLSSAWRAARAGVVRVDRGIIPSDLTDFEPSNNETAIAGRTTRPSPGLNVIFIVLESVAARWTGISGGTYETTPQLKMESASAADFGNFYAHVGRSSDSLPAMLLSRYPKLNFRDLTEEEPRLPGTSVASLFEQNGYRTAFITSTDLTWGRWNTFLEGRGFDDVEDYRRLPCTPPISEWGVEDRCMVDAMIEFLGRDRQRPFFLMAWTEQTHYPYEPTPGMRLLPLIREPATDEYELGRYLNVLHETDRHLGRLFEAIRHAGIDRNTAVVITGDHGQGFGIPHRWNFSQGITIYEEDVHVPLLVWLPREFEVPVRSTTIGSHVDLAPTMAALAGLPPAAGWEGRNLFDRSHPPRAYFFVAEDGFMLGVREEQWKYIVNLRAGSEELYDLERDPTEQHNIASGEPQRCRRLRQRIAAWMEANRRSYQ